MTAAFGKGPPVWRWQLAHNFMASCVNVMIAAGVTPPKVVIAKMQQIY